MRLQLAPYIRKPPPIFASGKALRAIIPLANIAYAGTPNEICFSFFVHLDYTFNSFDWNYWLLTQLALCYDREKIFTLERKIVISFEFLAFNP